MNEPKPTRPDPGETQYGSRVPPPPPLQDNPRLIQHYGPEPDLPDPGRYEDEHTWWGRRRRRRINAEMERMEAEIRELDCERAHMRLLEEIAELEHSTGIVPSGSDPSHCWWCSERYWILQSLWRKADA